MDKWEYMVLEQPPGVRGFVDRQTHEEYPGTLHTLLNAVGAEGWQLMSTDTHTDGHTVVVLGRKGGSSFA